MTGGVQGGGMMGGGAAPTPGATSNAGNQGPTAPIGPPGAQ